MLLAVRLQLTYLNARFQVELDYNIILGGSSVQSCFCPCTKLQKNLASIWV